MNTTEAPPGRTSWPALIRTTAAGGPLLLLGYGIFWLIDGLDGAHARGLAWNIGHTFFLFGVLFMGVLAVALRQHLSGGNERHRRVANVATVATLVGVAAFEWVILGDLFPSFDDAVPVPEWVIVGGPVPFQLGLLTLLIQLVVARQVPAWSPVLVLLGYLAIPVDLNLLSVAAILILAGLSPLITAPLPPMPHRAGSGAPSTGLG